MIPHYELRPDSNLFYRQISMATPKANNDYFLRKTRNSPDNNLVI